MGMPKPSIFAQVLDLADAGADVVIVHRFVDADGHSLHVAASQATVGVESFVDHHQVARVFEDLPLVQGQEAADVDQGILLALMVAPSVL